LEIPPTEVIRFITTEKKSMRTDPQKYSSLIYYNRSLSAGNIDQPYTGYYYYYTHGQKQPYPSYDYFFEEYNSTLLEEAEKLYNKSVREWTEQIITEYSTKNSSSQLSVCDNKEQLQPKLIRNIPFSKNNQGSKYRIEKHIFVKTEF
jgi:hypothetical protein